MKITIPIQPDSSITKDITIELSNYTIFAGENNSGKTNLIKGMISTIGEDNVIYIPAESINAQETAKTSATGDPMRNAISKLLNIALGETPTIDGSFKELFKKIEIAFDSFEVANTDLKLEAKNFEKRDFEKILKDAVASKILEHKILDKHYNSEQKFGIDSVGQGIQRLIIATIIQEIGKIRDSGDELFILFEEPEIYLHPKLKSKLHDSLVELSKQSKVKVVVTTHDPYFIQLAKDRKIYNVLRDSEGSTYAKEVVDKFLPPEWRSFSEINYQVFGVNEEDYLNELYGYLETKLGNWRDVDKELAKKENKDKERNYLKGEKMTMTSYIRNRIHHRTNEKDYEPKDVIVGINNLQTISKEYGGKQEVEITS